MSDTPNTEITYTIELGSSFWVGIAFAGGCFTGNWIPLVVVLAAYFLGLITPRKSS